MKIKAILCKIFGHKWLTSGWSSYEIEMFNLSCSEFARIDNIPKDVLRSYRHCTRCGITDHFDESPDSVQARFDGYREKYGDAVVETDEFAVPWPEEK